MKLIQWDEINFQRRARRAPRRRGLSNSPRSGRDEHKAGRCPVGCWFCIRDYPKDGDRRVVTTLADIREAYNEGSEYTLGELMTVNPLEDE